MVIIICSVHIQCLIDAHHTDRPNDHFYVLILNYLMDVSGPRNLVVVEFNNVFRCTYSGRISALFFSPVHGNLRF